MEVNRNPRRTPTSIWGYANHPCSLQTTDNFGRFSGNPIHRENLFDQKCDLAEREMRAISTSSSRLRLSLSVTFACFHPPLGESRVIAAGKLREVN